MNRYLTLAALAFMSGCQDSNNSNVDGSQNPERTTTGWRLIATNDADIGITDDVLLYRYGYSGNGSLTRLWHYEEQPLDYSEGLLNNELLYQKNIGGGVFLDKGGFLTLEHWSLALGWTNNLDQNEGGGSAVVETHFYHSSFGRFGRRQSIRGDWGTEFDDGNLREDQTLLDRWTTLDEKWAVSHREAVQEYTLSDNADYIEQWLNHYSDYSYDEVTGSEVFNVFRCELPNYNYIGADNLDSDFYIPITDSNPITELDNSPCYTIELNRSPQGRLESTSIIGPTYPDSVASNSSYTEIVYSYSVRNSILVVEADKIVMTQGVLNVDKSRRSWAAYENISCSDALIESENAKVPTPFYYCLNY